QHRRRQAVDRGDVIADAELLALGLELGVAVLDPRLGAALEFARHGLVEALDAGELVELDRGDLLDLGEAFGHQQPAITSSTSSASTNSAERVLNSSCRRSDSSCSVRMSIAQPVSIEARRTFWPRRPIASESWSSGTQTSIRRASSSSTTLETSAGASALTTKVAGSGDHGMMSIFSPCCSATTACTRLPRMPTHAPTGSIDESLEMTAILPRLPGSRATALISMMPS